MQIITKHHRINADHITHWESSIQAENGRRFLILATHGAKGVISSYSSPLGSYRYADDIVTSLQMDAVHYMLAEKEALGESYCHHREIVALAFEALEYLKDTSDEGPDSFFPVAKKILGSSCDSRIDISTVGKNLSRIEAYMMLKSMEHAEPIEITITSCYHPDPSVVTVVYNPAGEEN